MAPIDPHSAEYKQAIEQWHEQRNEFMRKEWLNIAGLFWLEHSTKYRIGKDPSINDLELSGATTPAHLGVLERTAHDLVNFTLDPQAVTSKPGDWAIRINSVSMTPGETIALTPDGNEKGLPASVVAYDTVSWYPIKRGERVGIRVKDDENPAIKEFKGIKYSPIKPEYVVCGKWHTLREGEHKLKISDMLGGVRETSASGYLAFKLPESDGPEYRLYVEGSPDKELFILFRDGTSGKTTYGSGRFLRVPAPDADNNVQIDFNKAFNPPCAYTSFATCPLPPGDNWLHVQAQKAGKGKGMVDAGELADPSH
ncbi:hypothetical protein EV182_000536 [Spiromyces aspiralis]|uniref:Uncharacterized protein n=1 Tax=Spiromyces aspiralis TaxID=68401 RepID=A0ACC1HWY3_9FUNG|nr:hypothetical protein EV182_000536 [Spiromyces aspiralis]